MAEKAPRRCVFCRESGASEEHVFAKWISRAVSGKGKGMFEMTATHPPRPKRTAKIMAVTNRAVCKPCNEGWMSDLETAVRPLIFDAIQGRLATFAAATDRITVAAWAFKTALMLDCCWPDRNVPEKHYRYLYRRRIPPPNVYVSVAAYFPMEGEEIRTAWGNRSVWKAKPPLEKFDGYRITFSVGNIVFQAFGHPGTEHLEPEREVRVNGKAVTDFRRVVWPIPSEPVGWPPSRAFNAALVDELLV